MAKLTQTGVLVATLIKAYNGNQARAANGQFASRGNAAPKAQTIANADNANVQSDVSSLNARQLAVDERKNEAKKRAAQAKADRLKRQQADRAALRNRP